MTDETWDLHQDQLYMNKLFIRSLKRKMYYTTVFRLHFNLNILNWKQNFMYASCFYTLLFLDYLLNAKWLRLQKSVETIFRSFFSPFTYVNEIVSFNGKWKN